MNSKEMLKILTHQWCTIKDLMALAHVGRNSALDIKKYIKTKLEEEGYYVPKDAIPMEAVTKYLPINIEYLKQMAKLEDEINNGVSDGQ